MSQDKRKTIGVHGPTFKDHEGREHTNGMTDFMVGATPVTTDKPLLQYLAAVTGHDKMPWLRHGMTEVEWLDAIDGNSDGSAD